jgi:hypothetical protein
MSYQSMYTHKEKTMKRCLTWVLITNLVLKRILHSSKSKYLSLAEHHRSDFKLCQNSLALHY